MKWNKVFQLSYKIILVSGMDGYWIQKRSSLCRQSTCLLLQENYLLGYIYEVSLEIEEAQSWILLYLYYYISFANTLHECNVRFVVKDIFVLFM